MTAGADDTRPVERDPGRTGDYLSLGIAAQDALLALRGAGKVE